MKVQDIFASMRSKLDNFNNNHEAVLFDADKRKRIASVNAIAFFRPVEEYGATNEERQQQWMP
jgi:hypothetical protein